MYSLVQFGMVLKKKEHDRIVTDEEKEHDDNKDDHDPLGDHCS